MKALSFILVATLFCITTANAQITKGNWLVGGDAGFNHSVGESSNSGGKIKHTGFSIGSTTGYFLSDNLAVGTMLSVNFSNPQGDNNNSYGYGIGPFARYYFLEKDKIINPFAQAGYSYGKSHSQSGGDFSSSNFDLRAGPAIFFNSSVALEVVMIYTHTSNNNNDFKSNNFRLGIGFQIHLEKNN